MSDHEDTSLDTGYSTPVPELDDHRNQLAAVHKSRSRRGTVDTLYNSAIPGGFGPDLSSVNRTLYANSRDFEEAIADEESGGISPLPNRVPTHDRSRRGTVETMDPRSASPPNSVKAFADARRRERQMSMSDPSGGKTFPEARRYDEAELHRTTSGTSRRTYRSRRYTNDADAKSFAGSHHSVEDDVCFPLHDSAHKDELQIDFEGLEEFIADEQSRTKTPPQNQPQARVFNDLRAEVQSNFRTTVTFEGEAVMIPSSKSSILEKCDEAVLEPTNEAQAAFDGNRFEFFSSFGVSTIHAAEIGGLILPGEEIRTLFTIPPGEEMDGAWWLNMNNPTDEEIHAICKAFGVHPLTIEDIKTQETREKIELFPSYYFACFRSFHKADEEQYVPFNIYVIVFREGTLSFSFYPNDHANHVRRRIIMLKDYVSLSSDWICYALM